MSKRTEAWQKHWGTSYDSEFKIATIMEVLRRMSENGKLGRNIIDIGTGRIPVTILTDRRKHKIVDVDLCVELMPHPFCPNGLPVKPDIEELVEPSFSTRRIMARIAKFLDVPFRGPSQIFDCAILSEILNYIDGPRVLKALHPFIKPGGLVVILNGRRGDRELFVPNPPKDESDIIWALLDGGYQPMYVQPFDERLIPDKKAAEIRMTLITARRAEGPINKLAWANEVIASSSTIPTTA